MKNPKTFFAASTLAACLLAGPAAVWAQDALPLPAEKQSGSVSYVTGGVPDEQIAAFKAARSSYPLGIEIYQKAGAKSEFTSGVQVKVIDKSGGIALDAVSDGPYLWARVPAGTYRIEATLKDKMVSKQVTVASSGATPAVLVFPQGTD
jgi:hypothetical protein